ncbi:chemotaxis response regulator protein-glutamate methylesterase [Bacillus sp. FSL W8-0116]|uniref:protein-glutamate methylesterase/protein-glutamine glutaminase n=1 Tax=Bacillus sp. FSL W8-0116 TaxID=2978206 RepID=UPI0030F71D05
MGKKKVLIVDDSAFMRKLISDFVSEHPELEVVGTARNGKDAIEKVKTLCPDVVTMDIEMPVMNGLEALKWIISHYQLPVVMLSSTTKEGTENAIKALENGAFDFVAKPSGPISLDLDKGKNELISKLLLASKVKKGMKSNVRVHTDEMDRGLMTSNRESELNHRSTKEYAKSLVLIGTSTGGPRALQEVLPQLPKEIGAPILIVQHMPPGFTKSLAERLNQLSRIYVKEAEDGELLKKGIAYIAPGNFHMKIKEVGRSLAISLDQSPRMNGHKPSVDVLFESASKLEFYKKIAVILTGMGSDGTYGLIKLKEKGNVHAIAESKDSCVVFGMPKSAIEANVIDEVKPIQDIAQSILKYLP